ncbi:hypothetical protein BCR43DRAFT_343339 [Syncephalastrum racemosum]|uniref:Uncharacterized protein n=1 Tax=Syncephalastrum racemosum TaxID=13706 RepID=A0A1X2H964_SYNRA|nr:hypothetical protein BCR43DRAFT_343293 [Syncephalastrum racemosum]ORY95091.1 hypothetical protein BCR43DRAFT_343339 [Syncephalastrum racemosum]
MSVKCVSLLCAYIKVLLHYFYTELISAYASLIGAYIKVLLHYFYTCAQFEVDPRSRW